MTIGAVAGNGSADLGGMAQNEHRGQHQGRCGHPVSWSRRHEIRAPQPAAGRARRPPNHNREGRFSHSQASNVPWPPGFQE